ncbi:outer membrane protein assembly factor BamA [Candidatus Nitronereus thalassa]|uniref:Outer membrane protein assembly factor BamA n=1 Tax=Candidatus Nitronereus thalassa TaxID=3020898 RepID=A0ABU3K609_9BACT|nr:outer membrane protein assembly factor BamA [Candidatus Nitronereus thalassa]MDT7041823.1 outer membrane protein assembly factor BamA [Candidatus Nitronereus thalassa]
MDVGWKRPGSLLKRLYVRQFGSARFAVVCFGLVLSVMIVNTPMVLGQTSGMIVQSIGVQGNQRIEESAILARVTLNPGDTITTAIARQQIQRIYDMGFFDDVQVQTSDVPNGVRVIFLVKEKPFTVEIVFDGNEELSEDKLKELVTLQSQVFLDKKEVKASAEKIREEYQKEGYHNAKVIPIVQALDDTRNRITFFIQEGTRARIENIVFEGLTVTTKKELLGVMANREWVPLVSLLTDAGILRREELPNDVERIKEFYSNKGYLDVQVGVPTVELSEDKKSFVVTFRIIEGQPYTIGSVTFTGNKIFENEELELESLVQPDDVFQRSTIRQEVTRITDKYGEKGYSFAEVTPSLLPNPETLTTQVTFNIKEGALIRVRAIHISGNDKTRDNVIRREIRVDEQEVINSVAIKRSFQRLNNLNFFETVEILPNQVEEDKVDLEVKVKEKPTGSFSIGGGFSTLDQFTAIANISEGNLFGMGYLARIRGQLGFRRTLGVLTFRNPALFDGPTSFQVDGFSTQTDFLTYEEERSGGTIQFGRAFSEYIVGSFTLVGEAIEISNPSSDAPSFILRQVGDQSTTGFRASLFRDTRDNFQDPRSGSRSGIRLGFGSEVFGGTNNFYRVSLDGLKYVPLPIWDLRMAFRGRFGLAEGYGGDPVPLTELFFVGGINSVRGFKFGRAGPVTASGTLEGGNKEVVLNAEIIFPVLADAKLNGVVFFDYGKGFAEDTDLSFDLRPATGLEVRWISPFGPLRAAWGLNLDPKQNEQETVFEFSVGNVF